MTSQSLLAPNCVTVRPTFAHLWIRSFMSETSWDPAKRNGFSLCHLFSSPSTELAESSRKKSENISNKKVHFQSSYFVFNCFYALNFQIDRRWGFDKVSADILHFHHRVQFLGAASCLRRPVWTSPQNWWDRPVCGVTCFITSLREGGFLQCDLVTRLVCLAGLLNDSIRPKWQGFHSITNMLIHYILSYWQLQKYCKKMSHFLFT